MISAANSQILNKVRVPLALGVFLSHAAHEVNADLLDAYRLQGGAENVFYWIFSFLSTTLPIIVIPGFFLISGYLFFLKWSEKEGDKVWDWKCYEKKLSSRFFTLFIPYIIWNIIPLFVIVGECVAQHYDSSNLVQELKFSLQGKFPQMFWGLNKWGGGSTGPLNLPLYYLRDLMCMCLVAPIVFVFCKKTKWVGICLLILLNTIGFVPSVSGFRNTGITFFTLGACMSIMHKDIVDEFCKLGKYLLVPSLLFIPIILGGVQVNTTMSGYIDRSFSVVGLVSLFWIVRKLSDMNLFAFPKVFVESIFFTYAAHEGLSLLFLSAFMSQMLIPSSSAFMIVLQYLFSIVLVIAMCLLIYLGLKRFAPGVCSLLNGKYKYSRKLK